MAGLISGSFAIFAIRAGAKWQVPRDEALTVARPLASSLRRLSKRVPMLNSTIKAVGEPGLAIGALVSIVQSRLELDDAPAAQPHAPTDAAPATPQDFLRVHPNGVARDVAGQPLTAEAIHQSKLLRRRPLSKDA